MDNIRCKYKVKAQSSYNVSRIAIVQIGKHSSIWLRWQIVDYIQNLGALQTFSVQVYQMNIHSSVKASVFP